MPDLAIVLSADGRLLHAPPGWRTVFGEAAETALGRPVFESALGRAFGPSACDRVRVHLDSVRADQGGLPLSVSIPHPSGARVLEVHAHRDPLDPARITLVLRDATNEWSRLARLSESERRFGTMAEASRDMVSEADFLTGHFTYMSSGVEAVLGYRPAQLVGTLSHDLHHPDEIDGFLDDVRGARDEAVFTVRPHRLRRRDGSWVWVEATGVRFRRPDGRPGIMGVARDISARLDAEKARTELEAQLQRAQRLESLGVMAGGIAHDFNNLLTPILGSAMPPAAGEVLDRDDVIQRLETVRVSAMRAKALTGQMLSYAGRGAVHRVPTDLSQVVRDLVLLLETMASRSVKLLFDLDAALPPVEADTNQLGQIVMNLVANASEAANPDGGRIEVRTHSLNADRKLLDACALGGQLEAGRYACLEVSDNGRGMDTATRDRVFDPFFTTKFTGRGLGLAVVASIIRRHGGALQVESEPQAGSRFRVFLPFAPEASPVVTESEAPRPVAIAAPTGALLVVDDDDGAREFTALLLRRAGFDVVEARDGAEAVEIFRERTSALAGVVLDSTMPGMSGASAFAAIREIDPSARVLLVSGYTSDRDGEALIERGMNGFLQKPFEPEVLLAAVRTLVMPDGRRDQ